MSNNTQLLTDLRAMKALFAKDGTWTQEAYARTNKGRVVGPKTDNAVCFCLDGAAKKLLDSASPRYWAVVVAMADTIGRTGDGVSSDVQRYNDARGRTIEDVRKVIDAAISLAEKS